jgi:hypothetical protein
MDDIDYSRQVLGFLKSRPISLSSIRYLIVNARGTNNDTNLYQYELDTISEDVYLKLREDYKDLSNNDFFDEIVFNLDDLINVMTLTIDKNRRVSLDNKDITDKLKVYFRKEKMKNIDKNLDI